MAAPDFETVRQAAAEGFGLGWRVELEYLPQGRVNLSFKVRAPSGTYILQRLHPIFGDSGGVAANTDAVCRALAAGGVNAPQVVSAADGKLWTERAGTWRLMTWLEGRPAPTRNPEICAAAARFLGRFHRALADNPPELTKLPPAEYNRIGVAGSDVWARMIEQHASDPKMESAAEELAAGRDLAGSLPVLSPAVRGFIHGDPKIDNFLFDDGRAVGLIDLDTVRRGRVIWDLADALRSWANDRGADGRVLLNRNIFARACTAYQETGLDLPAGDWLLLPQAVAGISLNLARRYYDDYFNESYFTWDRERYESLAAQNLNHARGMLGYTRQILAAEEELRDACTF